MKVPTHAQDQDPPDQPLDLRISQLIWLFEVLLWSQNRIALFTVINYS